MGPASSATPPPPSGTDRSITDSWAARALATALGLSLGWVLPAFAKQSCGPTYELTLLSATGDLTTAGSKDFEDTAGGQSGSWEWVRSGWLEARHDINGVVFCPMEGGELYSCVLRLSWTL